MKRLLDAHGEIRVTQEFSLTQQRATIQAMLCDLSSSDNFGELPMPRCREWSDEIAVRYVHMLVRAELEQTGKRRYGDKTPLNTFHMAELDEMFPDASFIHIIRDGRAVAASLLERQLVDARFTGKAWAPKTGAQAAQSWTNAIRAARTYGAKLPRERYHELRYEELATRRNATVRRLFSFLEEKIDVGVERVRDEFFDRPRDWRATMPDTELESFRTVKSAVELLSELGYPSCGATYDR